MAMGFRTKDSGGRGWDGRALPGLCVSAPRTAEETFFFLWGSAPRTACVRAQWRGPYCGVYSPPRTAGICPQRNPEGPQQSESRSGTDLEDGIAIAPESSRRGFSGGDWLSTSKGVKSKWSLRHWGCLSSFSWRPGGGRGCLGGVTAGRGGTLQ